MNIEIIPVGTRVLVETEPPEEKTKGGIIRLQSTRDQQQASTTRGEILAMGDDAFCEIEKGSGRPEVGDQVYMARYAGMGLEEDNLRIVEDNDIVAVLENRK